MLTKGIVEEIITKYEVRVRIPIYHKVKGVQGATPTKDLPIAHTCIMFGIQPNYRVGDIVYVGFENNQLQNVVILGYLYNDKNVESYPDMTVNSLNTISKLNGANIDGSVSGDVVTSVFNRSGDVQAKYGDYSIEQISAMGSAGQVPMLNNNGRFVMGTPSAQVQADWDETDASKADFIKNKPVIPSTLADLSSDSTHRTVTDAEKSAWNNKSDFSGNYEDLTNKPDIPTQLSELSSDSTHRVVTDTEKSTWNGKSDFSGDYNDLNNKPSIPSKTSDLTNNSGFITDTVNTLINYYKKSETYTQTEVNELIASISNLHFEVVASLPTEDIPTNVIFLVLREPHTATDIYNEYIYINNGWELIGNTQIDLSNYVTISDLNTALSSYVQSSSLSQVATSGSYNDLIDKPAIPSVNNGTLTIKRNGTVVQTFTANQGTDVIADVTVPTALSELSADATHCLVTDTEKNTWNSKASTNTATSTSNGLMSATDKSTLDTLSTQAVTQTSNVLNGQLKANATAVATLTVAQLRNAQISNVNLVAGTSPLSAGEIYFYCPTI